MANTKITRKICVSDDFFLNDDLVSYGRKLKFPEVKKIINEVCKPLIAELEELAETEWVQIENKNVYYVHSENLVIKDSTREKCSRKYFEDFEGFTCQEMGQKQALRMFFENKEENRLVSPKDKIINKNDSYSGKHWSLVSCIVKNDYQGCINIKDGSANTWDYDDPGSINIPVYCFNDKNVFMNFVMYDLVPVDMSVESKNKLRQFIDMAKHKYISVNAQNKITVSDSLKQDIIDGKVKKIFGISFEKEKVAEFVKAQCKKTPIQLTGDALESFAQEFLNCDLYRADIEPYDLKRLTDINNGHWDLWTDSVPENKTEIEIDANLVGRHPAEDIHWDGLVGIDFGTKSTVVSYQDGSDKTYLHRIGMGQVSKRAVPKHYENPTVMEFIDLENFISKYNSALGRPETKWQDLTVSHTAQNNFNELKSGEDFYSYFYDIKQWCGAGTSGRQINIKDQNDNNFVLPSFFEIESGSFNPVEIYAYYLGLFINNMRNGIYLDYIMSFPVTYEKAIREKIIDSFSKGLKKSLPEIILKDNEIMSHFRVQAGASEPACYAICALQQFNIEPGEDEPVFYGIFDFGGGTTDFDFGVWRYSDQSQMKERRYDYVVEHFGAGGDQYLGGENLLELLTFEIFKANSDILLKNDKSAGFTFFKPEQCDKFDGSEALISNSQEAKRNTKSLMEILRPFVENLTLSENGEITPPSKEIFPFEGKITVDLLDKNGKIQSGIALSLDDEKNNIHIDMIKILEERIEKGVGNFFQAFEQNYAAANINKWKSISIFLAGNSSKSPIVKKLFNKYKADWNSKMSGFSGEDFPIIYPPLGTPEADEIQIENGIDINIDSITRANGKTGVAYGLLSGRTGSGILVKSQLNSAAEVPFKYYIGRNVRRKFSSVLSKDAAYNEWVIFTDAYYSDFEVYYSNLPEVESGNTPISEVKKKKCVLPETFEDDNVAVFIRAVKPNVIEYCVANKDDIDNDSYLIPPQKIEL